MSKRASEGVLGELHEQLAKDLLRRVQSGEASPAELNAAIKFLQNNGIEANMTEKSTLTDLARSLPNFNDQDDEYVN